MNKELREEVARAAELERFVAKVHNTMKLDLSPSGMAAAVALLTSLALPHIERAATLLRQVR